MASQYGKVKYTRRAEGTIRRSEKMTVIIIVAVVLVLFAIASVVIGLALGERTDEYTIETKYEFSFEPYKSGNKTVKAVEGIEGIIGLCRSVSGEIVKTAIATRGIRIVVHRLIKRALLHHGKGLRTK